MFIIQNGIGGDLLEHAHFMVGIVVAVDVSACFDCGGCASVEGVESILELIGGVGGHGVCCFGVFVWCYAICMCHFMLCHGRPGVASGGCSESQ